MKVPISKLLVNRSALTRRFGMAGSPVMQMATHVPMFETFAAGSNEFLSMWGKFAYNLVQDFSMKGGQLHTKESFMALYKSVEKYEIKEPLDGWNLNCDGYVEIFGGHHRAIIASMAGYVEIEMDLKPMDIFHKANRNDIASVKSVYDLVKKTENLKDNQSYNLMPGMIPIRASGQWRLETIYRDIITSRGNRLLDAGCNDGFFGSNLSTHDFYPTFLDRSEPYLNVCRAKMKLIKKDAAYVHSDIDAYLSKNRLNDFDVTLYLDVFYHTMIERGKSAAIEQLKTIMSRTIEKLIFAPGRWDRIEKAGCSQREIYLILMSKAKKIRYLGRDDDKNYGREIYSVSL